MAKDRDYQIEGIVFRQKGQSPEDIEFLLLKRTSQRGGFWQSVTGGAFLKENKIDALKRELKEELGIKEKDIKNIVDTNYSFSFVDDDGDKLQEYVYGMEISPEQEITISKEHTETRWVTLKESLKLLKWRENKKGFKKLHKIIINS